MKSTAIAQLIIIDRYMLNRDCMEMKIHLDKQLRNNIIYVKSSSKRATIVHQHAVAYH
jgi:hypothetical protein